MTSSTVRVISSFDSQHTNWHTEYNTPLLPREMGSIPTRSNETGLCGRPVDQYRTLHSRLDTGCYPRMVHHQQD